MHSPAGVYYTLRSAGKTRLSLRVWSAWFVDAHTRVRIKWNMNSNLISCGVWYWYLFYACDKRYLFSITFPPKYRCNDELQDNQKIVVLKHIIWSGCANMLRTCPWSYGSQNSTNATQSVVSYWQKYVHEVLVNRLGGLSLPRKSVVRLTDRPDMTSDVYRGRKTTMQ